MHFLDLRRTCASVGLNGILIAPRKARKLLAARRVTSLVVLLVVTLILSSCGGNSANTPDDRQFASDVHPSIAPQPTSPSAPTSIPVTAVPSMAPSTLLTPRGAPTYRYAVVVGTLISVDPAKSNAAPVVIHLPAGQRLLAFDSSPNGEQVAVALESTSGDGTGGTELELGLYDHTGKVVSQPRHVLSLGQAIGTPTPAAGAPGEVHVAWSPQGDQILVSTATGRFATVSAKDLTSTSISIATIRGTVEGAWWSPRGDSFLVLVRDASGRGSIAIATPKDGKATPDTVWPRSDELHLKTVRQVEWLPDGSGIVFTQADIVSGTPADYQLFALPLKATSPVVVATAGRGGPTAGIDDFALSPDGKSVAYSIVRPSGNGNADSFASLWVRTLSGSSLFQVPVGSVDEVNDIGWSRGGLVWNQSFDEGGRVDSVVVCKADSSVAQLATTGRPRPAATPATSGTLFPAIASPSPAAATPHS